MAAQQSFLVKNSYDVTIRHPTPEEIKTVYISTNDRLSISNKDKLIIINNR